jgi:membrane associated rhomboid family serine protease
VSGPTWATGPEREPSGPAEVVDPVAQVEPDVPPAWARPRAPGRPLTVWVLVAVNVAVYLWTAFDAGSVQHNFDSPLFDAWALWPPAVWAGQWWRLVTAGFLHFGPLHIGVNMWSLWVIGKDLERFLGRPRFLAVYVIGLLGGSVSSLFFAAPNSVTAGASGAVFALMGGLTVLLHRLRLSLRPALIMIAINLVFSVAVPGISLSGHVGGLLVGAAVTALMLRRARSAR